MYVAAATSQRFAMRNPTDISEIVGVRQRHVRHIIRMTGPRLFGCQRSLELRDANGAAVKVPERKYWPPSRG